MTALLELKQKIKNLYGQHEIRPTKSIHSENFC